MAKECTFCNFVAPNLNLWLSHIRAVHSGDANFEVECCESRYTKCASFVSHIYRKHRSELSLAGSSRTQPESVDEGTVTPRGNLQPLDGAVPDTAAGYSILDHATDQLLQLDGEVQKRQSALFLLRLKEVRCLSQVAVNDVVLACQGLFKHTMGRLHAGVQERLAACGVDSSEVPDLDNFLNAVEDPFKGLHSTYLQEKFYREKLGCLEPTEVCIGKAYYRTQFSGCKRKKVLRYDSFYYIPLEELLKHLLQQPEILRQVDHPMESKENILRDFCDGQVFKSHPLFASVKGALQIIAYFDEVEVCNPLGSAAKKHKLGCLFITLGNLYPEFRSSLKAIFLVAVAPSTLIKKHGMDEFMKPFVEELNKLSTTGISFSVSGEMRRFHVGLMVFLADNLGAHQVAGFKESMSFAHRICRSCMATTEQSRTHFLESKFELRTKEKHRRQCEQMDGPLHDHYSVEYGINRHSVLDTVSNFSVVDNLPHDVMHDVLEGVVPHELKYLLYFFCIHSKQFTIKDLNYRLVNFDYGHTEVCDKPAEIDENHIKKADGSIRQSASQMWLLAYVLPFLIADLVPVKSPHWECFLLLLKIMSICASWQVSYDMVDYLRLLIADHHAAFKELYPDATIKPKMHYMVHYPSQILAFGPLTNTWTMRYEAKLSVFKRASRHGNFKNICYTVAKRHQHRLCYHLNSNDQFLLLESSGGGHRLGCLGNETNELQQCIKQHFGHSVDDATVISRPTWVKTRSLHLRRNAYVLTGTGPLYPNFTKVNDIILVNSKAFLQLLYCRTLMFDSYYNSFAICSSMVSRFCHVHELPIYPVLHAHRSYERSNNNLYISPKHYIIIN